MTHSAETDAPRTTETYRRDDGWEVVVTHDGETVTAHVRVACRAHGYARVTPPAEEGKS